MLLILTKHRLILISNDHTSSFYGIVLCVMILMFINSGGRLKGMNVTARRDYKPADNFQFRV